MDVKLISERNHKINFFLLFYSISFADEVFQKVLTRPEKSYFLKFLVSKTKPKFYADLQNPLICKQIRFTLKGYFQTFFTIITPFS